MTQVLSSPLVVVGSVALDSVKSPFGKVHRALGGSAVYFSLAARFFTPVSMVGVVGQDFPRPHLDLLKRLKIDTRGIQVQKGKTFFWKGYYGFDLNSAITQKTELNVFQTFNPVLSAAQRRAPYLFLANIDPHLQHNVLTQMLRPKWVACDTMNFWIEHAPKALLKVLKKVDISLLNDAEIRQLSGKSNLIEAAHWVMKLGPKVVIVKRGEHGAVLFIDNDYFMVPAYLMKDVKDPTGAGDSFAGAFLGYLSRQGKLNIRSVREAMVFGSVLASFNIESFSVTRLANLTRKEIDARYQEFKRRTHF